MNMFKSTAAKTPNQYVNLFPENDQQNLKILDKLIQNETQLKPYILSGMLAYGSLHYKSKGGREGDWMLIGLARQKNYFSLYICSVGEGGKYVVENYKDQLPKANIGKGCIRFKKLEDLDLEIVKKILKEAVKYGGFQQS